MQDAIWLLQKKMLLMLGKIEGKKRRGWQTMRWLDHITDSMDMSLSKFQVTVKDREPWSAAVHGFAKGRTVLSSWTTTTTESSACRWTTFGLSIYNSTQNWHYLLRQHQIPQVKGSVLSDCLSLLPSEAISSPGCYLYFGVTGCKSEVHKTPFLCSVTSL